MTTSTMLAMSNDHSFSGGQDKATAAPQVQPAPVSSGAAAGLAIALMVVGVVLITVPYYILVVRKKSDNATSSYTRSQLTMDDMNDEQE